MISGVILDVLIFACAIWEIITIIQLNNNSIQQCSAIPVPAIVTAWILTLITFGRVYYILFMLFYIFGIFFCFILPDSCPCKKFLESNMISDEIWDRLVED